MARVSLGKKQLSTEAGKALLHLLGEITRDGELSLDEVERLRAWLEENKACAEVPAIAWLRELLQAVLADGKVTQEERVELLLAFDKVLPPEDRLLAKVRRRNAAAHDQEAQEPAQTRPTSGSKRVPWQDQPATEKQFDYMRFLGVQFDEATITKGQASELITAAAAQSQDRPSNRQMMVLRFWNRLEIASDGREAVSEWMDEWYDKDPRHREAWELWKQENGDDGGQGDPNRVPIGAGPEFLKRLNKQPKAKEAAKSQDHASGWIGLAVILVLIWLVYMFGAEALTSPRR